MYDHTKNCSFSLTSKLPELLKRNVKPSPNLKSEESKTKNGPQKIKDHLIQPILVGINNQGHALCSQN